jgi:hypothetical protein
MITAFRPMAKGGDVQAGALVARVIESRRIMLGLSLPARADQVILDSQAPPAKNSTERIAEVINRLCLEGPEKPRQDA